MEPTQGTSEVVKALAAYGGLYREERNCEKDALSETGSRVFRTIMEDQTVVKPMARDLTARAALVGTIKGNIEDKGGFIIGVSKRTLTCAKAALTALTFDLGLESSEFENTLAALNRMTILGEVRPPQQRTETDPEVALEESDIELPPIVQFDLGADLPPIVINTPASPLSGAPTALDLRTPDEGVARAQMTSLRKRGPTDGHRQFNAIVDKFGGKEARNAQGRFIGYEIAKFATTREGTKPSIVIDEGYQQIGMRPKEAENLMKHLHQRTTGKYSEGSYALYRTLLVKHEGKLFVKTINRSIGEDRSVDGRKNGVKYYEVRDNDDMTLLFGLDKDLETQEYVDFTPYK